MTEKSIRFRDIKPYDIVDSLEHPQDPAYGVSRDRAYPVIDPATGEKTRAW